MSEKPIDWNAMAAAGLTWDQAEQMPTSHEGGLWLRTPKGGDAIPSLDGAAVVFDPNGKTDMALRRGAAVVRWLVLQPELTAEQVGALTLIVRRLSPGDASPSAVLRTLPSAWLAYQRGER
jgi:hypothetical protein